MALRVGDTVRNTAQKVTDADGYEVVKSEKQRNWSQSHSPAAAAVATTTRAAGGAAGRHVCTGIIANLFNTTAALGNAHFVLRDGATGAGTILAEFDLVVPAVAGSLAVLALTDLNIEGSLNTALTLETTAAPPAAVTARVTLTGYTV